MDTEKNESTMGMRIAHLRNKHNMSQKALGEKIGVGNTTISNYERDYSAPDIEMLKKLSFVFGVDYSYFLCDDSAFKEKFKQSGVFINRIPFYDETNINGIITGDEKLADSYISLPSDTVINENDYICTKTTDNSMSNIGITNNSYIIINTTENAVSGKIVALFDTYNKNIIVRKYIKDGPMALFISDGNVQQETICTNINDKDFLIIGTVEKAIINL